MADSRCRTACTRAWVAAVLAGSALVSIGVQVRSGQRERAEVRMALPVD